MAAWNFFVWSAWLDWRASQGILRGHRVVRVETGVEELKGRLIPYREYFYRVGLSGDVYSVRAEELVLPAGEMELAMFSLGPIAGAWIFLSWVLVPRGRAGILRPMNTPSRAELGTFLSEHGLGRVARALAEAARPCVHVATRASDEDEIEVGASKMGGCPDLPAGFEWPEKDGRRLQFLVQIRCEEVAALDATGTLPRSGYLWFFYDVEEQPWGIDPKDRGGWAVRYAEVGPGALTRAEDGGDAVEATVEVCGLSFRAAFSLPQDVTGRTGVELTDEESDALMELPDAATEEGKGSPLVSAGHRLLGYPMPVQGDEMEEECETASGPRVAARSGQEYRKEMLERTARWRLLMQVDTDDRAGVMWGDCGMLYFWIPEESLAARRFEDVWLVLQCY